MSGQLTKKKPEGYIYSDSSCYPVIFVNYPTESVHTNDLAASAV